MKKQLLLSVVLSAITMLSAQTYEDVTPTSFVQGIANYCSSATGDFNSDGKLDIILTGKETSSGLNKTWLYLNDGAGGFTLSDNSGLSMGFNYSSIGVGDYDGDGDLDLVMQGWDYIAATSTSTQRAYVYKNDGSGTFTQVAELDGRSNGSIEFGDYDNDGKMDILQIGWKASISTGKATIYHNVDNSSFTDINNTTLFALADGEARFGDYDNDGYLDIIANGWMQAKIFKGDGTGAFTPQSITLPGYDFSYVSWIDYNQDGFKDILLGGHYIENQVNKFSLRIFKGNGTNTFTEDVTGIVSVQKGPIRVADCNNDGKLDFFISGWAGAKSNGGLGGVFQIWKNDGTNTSFSSVAELNAVISGWADGTLEVADFDGDGYVEIFKCGWAITKLYKNTSRNNTTTSLKDLNITNEFSASIKNNLLSIHYPTNESLTHVTIMDLAGKSLAQYQFSGKESMFSLPKTIQGICLINLQNTKINTTKIVTTR